MRVVIIGSGLAGVTTAWFLRQQGADVVVVERASAAARPKPTTPGTFVVPARRFRSWLPPSTIGDMAVPRRM